MLRPTRSISGMVENAAGAAMEHSDSQHTPLEPCELSTGIVVAFQVS